MQDKIYISYSKILKKNLIKEGDILLFRGSGFIAFFIKSFTNNPYTHIGLASYHNGKNLLELIEIREFYGGRSVNLASQLKKNPNNIDVYRISSPVYEYKSKLDSEGNLQIEQLKLEYNGRVVSNALRFLTGISYGYKRIFEIWLRHAPVLRLFVPWDFQENKDVYPICSSAISYVIRENFTDLVHFSPDKRTSPGDISKSPLTNYMFTILKD